GAGTLSWLFNYPQDIIKSRFQANDAYKTYWDCIRTTYAERGLRTFFVGLNSALIRAFPSNAATFFTVEWTYRLLLDFNILGVHTVAVAPVTVPVTVGTVTVATTPAAAVIIPAKKKEKEKRTIGSVDLWSSSCLFMLPEAGSTSIDPMIHGCRFI
ncbi:unnamed protein product, partial [Caenorhabditis auriculariae]